MAECEGSCSLAFPTMFLFQEPIRQFSQLLTIFIPIKHLGTWEMTLGTMNQTWARTPFITLDSHSNRDYYDSLGINVNLYRVHSTQTFSDSTFPNEQLPEQMIGAFGEVQGDSLTHLYHSVTWSCFLRT